jgi:hypothetical protein
MNWKKIRKWSLPVLIYYPKTWWVLLRKTESHQLRYPGSGSSEYEAKVTVTRALSPEPGSCMVRCGSWEMCERGTRRNWAPLCNTFRCDSSKQQQCSWPWITWTALLSRPIVRASPWARGPAKRNTRTLHCLDSRPQKKNDRTNNQYDWKKRSLYDYLQSCVVWERQQMRNFISFLPSDESIISLIE